MCAVKSTLGINQRSRREREENRRIHKLHESVLTDLGISNGCTNKFFARCRKGPRIPSFFRFLNAMEGLKPRDVLHQMTLNAKPVFSQNNRTAPDRCPD